MLPVKTMMNQDSLRVNMVKNLVSIARLTGSKNDNLEVRWEISEQLERVRANIDAYFYLLVVRQINGYLNVMVFGKGVVAMNKSFV